MANRRHAVVPSVGGQYPDIAAELAAPTVPCDALSFGMHIEAEPARIGSVLPPVEHQRLCPPETDPRFDSCEPESP